MTRPAPAAAIRSASASMRRRRASRQKRGLPAPASLPRSIWRGADPSLAITSRVTRQTPKRLARARCVVARVRPPLYAPAPMNHPSDPAFLICVEHGRLESEAILLVESLRAWGGSCADAPVYAFAPRPDFQPEPATVERLVG